MTIRRRSFLFLGILLCISILLVSLTYLSLNRFGRTFDKDFPEQIAEINRSYYIKFLVEKTLHFDEVLTQAARNYAFTKNIYWKHRYEYFEQQLDSVILEARGQGASEDIDIFLRLDSVNRQLLALEHLAFEMVENGTPDSAIILLDGGFYWNLKAAYTASVNRYNNDRLEFVRSGLTRMTDRVAAHAREERRFAKRLELLVLVFVVILMASVTSVALAFGRKTLGGIAELQTGAERIRNGDFKYRIPALGPPEFNQLSASFNAMAAHLEELTERIRLQLMHKELDDLRASLSRELHDRLGIIISSLKLRLSQLEPALESNPDYQIILKDCEFFVDDAYLQIRELSFHPIPEILQTEGLKHTLNELFVRIQLVFSVTIKFITNLDENDFNPTEKNAIYLLFRELLNNSIKHGSAEKIEIQIIQHEDGYVLMFEDNGKGFEPSLLAHSRGKGFRNMQTRVDELGGKLYIDSRPGRGATITVDLPRMIQNASYHDN